MTGNKSVITDDFYCTMAYYQTSIMAHWSCHIVLSCLRWLNLGIGLLFIITSIFSMPLMLQGSYIYILDMVWIWTDQIFFSWTDISSEFLGSVLNWSPAVCLAYMNCHILQLLMTTVVSYKMYCQSVKHHILVMLKSENHLSDNCTRISML